MALATRLLPRLVGPSRRDPIGAARPKAGDADRLSIVRALAPDLRAISDARSPRASFRDDPGRALRLIPQDSGLSLKFR